MTIRTTMTCDGCGREIEVPRPLTLLNCRPGALVPLHFCTVQCIAIWASREMSRAPQRQPRDFASADGGQTSL